MNVHSPIQYQIAHLLNIEQAAHLRDSPQEPPHTSNNWSCFANDALIPLLPFSVFALHLSKASVLACRTVLEPPEYTYNFAQCHIHYIFQFSSVNYVAICIQILAL
jgi:hypothetical protein